MEDAGMNIHQYWIALQQLFQKKPKFRIEGGANSQRLISKSILSAKDFQQIATQLGVSQIRAQKIGKVAAYQAEEEETIETLWNGEETKNVAQPGDWIVTNLSPISEVLRDAGGNKNIYVISKTRFPELYIETQGSLIDGQIYQSNNKVSALPLPGGFDIVAPWGERQTGETGYLLLNKGDVYGNSKDTFDQTYKIL